MKPDNNPVTQYGIVAGVVGQVGCLILLVVLGSLVAGLILDQIFGTRPLFIFILLLVSVPLTIWIIFMYTRYKSEQLQTVSDQKEEDISE